MPEGIQRLTEPARQFLRRVSLAVRVKLAPSVDVIHEEHRLKNGALLINDYRPGARLAAFYIGFKAGSRDETPETSGLAHMLEHMFFKGTEKNPTAKDIVNKLALLKWNTNAYTGNEDVCYFAWGVADNLKPAAGLMADMLLHPTFPAEELEKERGAVRQELSMYASDDEGWVSSNISKAIFGPSQPLSWDAAGSDAVVQRVTRDDLLKYHRHFYSPERMVIAVSGGAKLAPADVEALFEGMPRGEPLPRVPAQWGTGPSSVYKMRPVLEGEEPKATIQLALPGFSFHHDQADAMEVMATILGKDMNSRLFQSVREEHGLCYRIEAANQSFEDTGIFLFFTMTRPEDAAKASELIGQELRRLAAEPPTDEEMTAARNLLDIEMLTQSEKNSGLGLRSISQALADVPRISFDEAHKAFTKVTPADVQRVAQYLVDNLPQARIALTAPEDISMQLLSAFQGKSLQQSPPELGGSEGLAA